MREDLHGYDSGAKSERPGLQEAMNHLRAGDTLVVWRLDRLGRTLKHLIATITDLSDKGIGFKSLQENMDTTTSGGKLIFHIFGGIGRVRARSHQRTHQCWATSRTSTWTVRWQADDSSRSIPRKLRSRENSTPTGPCQ